MNLKNIMDKYTKKSLLDEFCNLYPECRESYTGYDYIIDRLKSEETIKSDTVLYIEMSMAEGTDTYTVYGSNNQEKHVNLSLKKWAEWISMEIDPDILEYMDEKIAFSHILFELSNHGYEEVNCNGDARIEFIELIENTFGNPDMILPFSLENLLDEMNKTNQMLKDSLNFTDLGTFNMESDKLIVSDIVDSNDRVVLHDVKQGLWHAMAVDFNDINKNDNESKDYIEFTLKHDDLKDEDIYMLSNERPVTSHDEKIGLKSKKVIAMDFSHYDELKVFAKDVEPHVEEFGAVCLGGKDNGPFIIYKYIDEEGKLIAVRLILTDEDADEEIYF